MDKKLKAKWVRALRSGKFRRGMGVLERINPKTGTVKNCCLGVLCRIAGVRAFKADDDGDVSFGFKTNTVDLGETLRARLGLSRGDELCLVRMNDGQERSFKYIASWIEKHL